MGKTISNILAWFFGIVAVFVVLTTMLEKMGAETFVVLSALALVWALFGVKRH